MKDLLIKNGRVVDPGNGFDAISDIYICDGIIKDIKKSIDISASRIIDASGSFVVPGLVDMHVHFREPGQEQKEDIESGSMAALHGGFTTVACMPNTDPVVDNEKVINYIKKRARQLNMIEILPIASITKNQQSELLCEMDTLKKAGAIAISDDGRPVESASLMLEALEKSKHFGILLISHCEDLQLSKYGLTNKTKCLTTLGLPEISSAAETIIVARDILLAEYANAKIHIAHVSTKGSVDIVRTAKARGVQVTAETAPHYFSLTKKEIAHSNQNAKVNPPLRTEQDIESIVEGLIDGTIDVIATDHAPHTFEDKDLPFEVAANGISGLETALAVGITYLVNQNKISISDLIRKMSYLPAKILNVDGGMLQVGKSANIAIFNAEKMWTVDKNKLFSKGKNTPYHGRELSGVVQKTIARGKLHEFN